MASLAYIFYFFFFKKKRQVGGSIVLIYFLGGQEDSQMYFNFFRTIIMWFTNIRNQIQDMLYGRRTWKLNSSQPLDQSMIV